MASGSPRSPRIRELVPDGDRGGRAGRRSRSCGWRGRCRDCCAGWVPRSCTRSTRVPLRAPCPCVVTIHDLSFERDATVMGRRDRWIFRTVVPRAARRAARVLTVSERSRRDLVELYGLADEKVVVTPNGVDPAFSPGQRRRVSRRTRSRSGPSRRGRTSRRRSPPPATTGSSSSSSARCKDEACCRRAASPRVRAARGLRSARAARRALPRCCVPHPGRRGSRGSGSPSSRRWRAGRRSSVSTSPRSGRSPRTRR